MFIFPVTASFIDLVCTLLPGFIFTYMPFTLENKNLEKHKSSGAVCSPISRLVKKKDVMSHVLYSFVQFTHLKKNQLNRYTLRCCKPSCILDVSKDLSSRDVCMCTDVVPRFQNNFVSFYQSINQSMPFQTSRPHNSWIYVLLYRSGNETCGSY